jgi:hypothetical protein
MNLPPWDHPYEAQEKANQKEKKRKAKESQANEKQTRKKQKEDQKVTDPHFSEFLKAKMESGYV